ncbi:hypothetical protein HH308_05035 [Gordonia sp. TBRC 11910]|uniref:Uncharacterized protein n=1 Tax=Gordonia asplenii TaxID=2725283 RepID=A0A848KYR8_9ACTN|nr:hypothetical protein [Gordonia asplenii]NMO00578.1 hypothetical protein [Gordonia asplenii]
MIESFTTWFDAQTAKSRTWARARWHRVVAGQVMCAMLTDRDREVGGAVAIPAVNPDEAVQAIEIWRSGRRVVLDGYFRLTSDEALELARELARHAAAIDRAD